MSEFATASLTRRRQILEDALASVLQRVGDIGHDRDGERCLEITVRRDEGMVEQEVYSLFGLARELEVLLS